MKNSKKSGKLSLNKATISALNTKELNSIKGGDNLSKSHKKIHNKILQYIMA